MGKKDKKKGRGAEKTAAKTQKKAIMKAKKELAAKGEDEIEKLIAEFQEKDKEQSFVGEKQCAPPSLRSGFSLCAHPEKDELLLFGGEYFNGAKTEMYNDLYFYNIKKDQWTVLQCREKPPPRCSHQAVILAQGGGQMWVFGGEFASPTRSNFYHYKDLWVYNLAEQTWRQIKATGGPSSRSGHRMVASRKRLIVFGGFNESLREYKYFNDVHVFDLESYQWTKVEPVGNGPCPRSGCQMAALSDGKIIVYGGYSREKVKKDVDKGISHSDMYSLHLDERSGTPKWKWSQVKQAGIPPSSRCGFSIAPAPNDRAFFFGGVHDEEDNEEMLTGIFHNDLYALEMANGRWLPISLHGSSKATEKKRRRKAKETGENEDAEHPEGMAEGVEDLSLEGEPETSQAEVKTYEDDVFSVRVGPSLSTTTKESEAFAIDLVPESEPFKPHSRMNAAMVVKHSVLYLYGGLYEDGDKQYTLCDFYSLDLHKLDEWKTIIACNIDSLEWCESEKSSSGSDGEGSDADDDDSGSDDEADPDMEVETASAS